MAKITLILSIVFGLATAGVGFLNFQKLGGLKGSLADTQTRLASTETTLGESQKKNEELEKTATGLNEKIAALTSEGEKLKAENAIEKTKASDLGEQVAMKDAELNSQKGKLESQAQELVEVKERLSTLESTPTLPPEDAEKIGKLEEENSKLIDQIASLKSQVNEFQRIKNEEKTKVSLKGFSGRILAVNQAWNFVVVDIGDKNGALANSELLVKRGDTAIGRVRITSVEPASSIADIIPASVVPGLTIRPGDEVIYPNEGL